MKTAIITGITGQDGAYLELLIGDPTKARTKLGWEPQYDLNMLVREMMESDVVEIGKAGRIQLEHLIS